MKFMIKTVGCKLNHFESRAVGEMLTGKGFEEVQQYADADILLINSCTVTARAETKTRQIIHQGLKHGLRVVVTGCYVTTDMALLKEKYGRRVEMIDNTEKMRIPEFLDLVKQNYQEEPVNQKSISSMESSDFPYVEKFDRVRAEVKIQDGCNRFCTYCKIPFARGRSRSMNSEEVLKSVEKLTGNGFREIVLTGINISDYRENEIRLPQLLKKICDIKREYRIRLSSLQPDLVDDELIAMIGHPKIAPHFHLSLQSGSNRILKKMNRHYRMEEFADKIREIRNLIPDAGITTDLIIGFPGETEEDFQCSVKAVQDLSFSRVHLFPYSVREGTAAGEMKKEFISDSVKKERMKLIRREADLTAKSWLEKHIIGRPAVLLGEKIQNGGIEGYTGNYLKCRVENELQDIRLINRFLTCVPEAYSEDKQAGYILTARLHTDSV